MPMNALTTWDWVILQHMIISIFIDKEDSGDTQILQKFGIDVQGLCIKLNSDVAYMFYAWSFNYNISVPIYMKQKKYYLFLHTCIILSY